MISREELYELVWSKPMSKVAEQFEVSGSYMARICSVLNVPRPERGYWAKLAVGTAPPQRPLPEAQPGDQLFWSRDGELPAHPKTHRSLELPRPAQAHQPKPTIHGLIRGAKAHFESGRPVKEGSHLKPYKKLLVDITASKACLDKALSFANDVFNALESRGHRVMLAPSAERMQRAEVDEREDRSKRRDYSYSNLWSPYRPTVVYVGPIPIGLAIIEMTEQILMRYVGGRYIHDSDYKPPKASRHFVDHTWTTTKDLPSGRLRLIAYSPDWRVSWSLEWQDTKDISLKTLLPTIVKAIEESADGLVRKIEEADRQAENERRRWKAEEEKRKRQEDKRQVDQSIRDSREQLEQVIQRWAQIMNVERFLVEAEDRASKLPENERVVVAERLHQARAFLGTLNPLDFLIAWKTPAERYTPRYENAEMASKGEQDVE